MTVPPLRKVDLHIHTPESYCYNQPQATLKGIVDAALAAKLDAIAITDHNSFRSINEIQKIAAGKGLVIFPGAELTTDCGHFVALFEPGTSAAELNPLLDILGVDPERKGDGAFTMQIPATEVIEKVAEQGGLAIAAHIERWPSGLLESRQPKKTKMEIHASPFLSALEITIPANKIKWNNGEMRDYPKKYACIQGSDAHNPDEIGRRPVYIRMDRMNLEALHHAFAEPETSIFFPDEAETA